MSDPAQQQVLIAVTPSTFDRILRLEDASVLTLNDGSSLVLA